MAAAAVSWQRVRARLSIGWDVFIPVVCGRLLHVLERAAIKWVLEM